MKNLRDVFLSIRDGALIREYARQADRESRHITFHNYPHFRRSARNGEDIPLAMNAVYPGTFKPEYSDFIGPMIGLCHDVDRRHGKRPHVPGQDVRDMMEAHGVPHRLQLIVLFAIANHSAGPSRTALRYESKSDEMRHEQRLGAGLGVLADALDAWRDRCRADMVRYVEAVKGTGKGPQHFGTLTDETPMNWMANYAIRSRPTFFIDPNERGWSTRYRGSFIIKWDIDGEVCYFEQIMSIPWFAQKHHGCENATQNVLGLNYGIEAHGKRWFCARKKGGLWMPKDVASAA